MFKLYRLYMSTVIEVNLAVTGVAAYDYDLRLNRSITKAGACV